MIGCCAIQGITFSLSYVRELSLLFVCVFSGEEASISLRPPAGGCHPGLGNYNPQL